MTDDQTYELKMSDQSLSAQRREVRAARLRLRRDKGLGVEVPAGVVQLAGIDLPPVAIRYRLAHPAQPGAGGKASRSYSKRRQAGSNHELNQAIQASATETTDGMEQPHAADTGRPEQSAVLPLEPFSGKRIGGAATFVAVQNFEVEHSGNVTFYLPIDLNRWLTDQHNALGVSYPDLVLNTISWAAKGDRLREIFPPDDSGITDDDLFGRPPVRPKPSADFSGMETRRMRFRKDHMKVIIGLARRWTEDNRNAFFVGVLKAYRDHGTGLSA